MSEKTQVAGNHYLGLAIQPRDLAMQNRWDSDAFSILKYITRYPDKAGIEDVLKARHYAEMRRDWGVAGGFIQSPERWVLDIPIARYVEENDIATLPALVLAALEHWVYEPVLSTIHAAAVLDQIDAIISWLDSTD